MEEETGEWNGCYRLSYSAQKSEWKICHLMAIEYLVSPASQSLACHQWLHTAKGIYTRDQLLAKGAEQLRSAPLRVTSIFWSRHTIPVLHSTRPGSSAVLLWRSYFGCWKPGKNMKVSLQATRGVVFIERWHKNFCVPCGVAKRSVERFESTTFQLSESTGVLVWFLSMHSKVHDIKQS